MKTIETVTEPTQFPPFWTEEWLETAIKELDTRALSPEKRLAYEMTLSANALAIENEQKKIEEAQKRGEETAKTEVIARSLNRGKLTIEEIAEDSGVSVDFVLEIQRGLAKRL